MLRERPLHGRWERDGTEYDDYIADGTQMVHNIHGRTCEFLVLNSDIVHGEGRTGDR